MSTAAAALCLALAACGGGDDSSSAGSAPVSSTPSTSKIGGTVATGAPASNVAVTAYAPNGSSCGTATTAADGTYTLTGTCSVPYVLVAQTAKGLLVTPVINGQTNGSITPITTAIYASATGIAMANASTDSLASSVSALTPAQLTVTKTSVLNNLAALFPAYAGWSGLDPFASFNADHSGVDQVIDQLSVQLASAGSVTFVNTTTSQQFTVKTNSGGAPTVGPIGSGSDSPAPGSGSGDTPDSGTTPGDGSSGNPPSLPDAPSNPSLPGGTPGGTPGTPSGGDPSSPLDGLATPSNAVMRCER